MFKRIRGDNLFGYPFLYLSVSERGSKRSRPHFHGLILVRKEYGNGDPLFTALLETKIRNVLFHEWRRNYGSRRNPDYRPLFTYRTKYVAGIRYSNFDCHYCAPHTTDHGESDVAFYVTKYVLKSSANEVRLQQALRLNLPPEEYSSVWRIVRSKCTKSLDFGSVTPLEVSFVKNQISSSCLSPEGLHFLNPDGSRSPLPRYYRRYVSPEAAISSVAARGGPQAIRDRSLDDFDSIIQKSSARLEKVSNHDISELTT